MRIWSGFVRGGMALVWAVLLTTLVVPPSIMAGVDSTVSHYEVEWPEIGKLVTVEQSSAGFRVRDSDGTFERFISQAPGKKMAVQLLKQEPSGIVAFVTFPDGLGGEQVFTVTGAYDRHAGDFVGDVFASDGSQLASDLTIRGPVAEAGTSPNAVIIIILSVGVVVAAVCGFVALATNCIADCGEACGPVGLAGAAEGLCGTCVCACGRDSGGGGDGDPGEVCPEGFHDCGNGQCCIDTDPPPPIPS